MQWQNLSTRKADGKYRCSMTLQMKQQPSLWLKQNNTRSRVCKLHTFAAQRKGFKAGALENGLKSAKGEFICIFDADFVPPPDFLLRTLPYFANEKTGMVQTRWTHLNKNTSLLTHFQAFLLDAHFSVEQWAETARVVSSIFRERVAYGAKPACWMPAAGMPIH